MSGHFGQNDALGHMLEKRTKGMLSVSEVHGNEMPGHFSAAADACKETALLMGLAWLFLIVLSIPFLAAFAAFLSLGLGWAIWKAGRSGRLGWAKLERLHRLIEQEKYEIDHHRPQEREELLALYKAKGFEGRLLNEIVDVLMADQDRLLKVMLEEEMGLTLQAYEHPIQQTLGALIGALLSVAVSACFFFLLPTFGPMIATFLLMIGASIVSSRYEKNQVVPAVIWNLSICVLAGGAAYFLFQIFSKRIS